MQETMKRQQDSPSNERRTKSAFSISVATGVIFTLIAVSGMIINRSAKVDASLFLMLITIIASIFSAMLNRRGKSNLGILLVISGLIILTIGRVFVQKGLAIPTGIINIILVSTIAIYTLPTKWAERVIGVSFLTTLATIIIDQYTSGVSSSSTPQIGTWIALTLGGISLLILAAQFAKFNLRTKLITSFLFLSTVPLILLGWQTYTTSQGIVQKQVETSLSENSSAISKNFESYLNEQIIRMSTEVSLEDIVDYVSLPKSERSGSFLEKHALNALKTFASKDPKFIISYSLIDANGLDLLDTVRANVNASYKDQIFFTEPLNTQKPYISGVLFPRKFTHPIIYFAVPIIGANNQTIGVLLATYKSDVLQSTLEKAVQNRTSKTEYTFLIDSVYFINLAHSSKSDLLYKSYLNIDAATLLDLQGKNIIPQGSRETLLVPQVEVVDALRTMGTQTSFEAPSWENNGAMAKSAATRVPNTTWIVVTSETISAINDLTQSQTRVTVSSSAIIIIIAAIIALLASNLFTTPIAKLTETAKRISAGDFEQKANIQSHDEIGMLGRTFDTMMDEIQGLIGNLEKRVEERTSDLGKATAQSEKRASELQTISEIARYISTEKDLESLLPLITHTVSEKFGFYHVGIFLLNDNKKFAVLRAANSPGGQVMLQRQHKLEVGQTGIVGNVTSTGVPRIALDTGADAVYFNNPDLPETHSEMALPLTVRGEVIGALDVQSTQSNAFTTSDISILSLLADQIAIAIDNAHLLEESRKALAESQSIFNEYVAQAWQSKSTSNVMGYYQTLTGGQVITRQTAQELNAVLNSNENSLAVPIQLRGQAIGTLNIRLNKSDEQLTTEQISIIQSVTERLGLALENARLFEETSTRASRERLVTDITTKIRGTNDPQEMIKTAMEELKRALGASHIEVIPKKTGLQQDK